MGGRLGAGGDCVSLSLTRGRKTAIMPLTFETGKLSFFSSFCQLSQSSYIVWMAVAPQSVARCPVATLHVRLRHIIGQSRTHTPFELAGETTKWVLPVEYERRAQCGSLRQRPCRRLILFGILFGSALNHDDERSTRSFLVVPLYSSTTRAIFVYMYMFMCEGGPAPGRLYPYTAP